MSEPTEIAVPDAWDRTGEWIAKHGSAWALLLLTCFLSAIYFHVFAGEVVGDDNTFHFAESARLADCIRQHDWDFWNPSANAGYASLYYYQAVPQLASAIPTALFGHHLFWFQCTVFFPHALAPLAAYRGARLLGATPWQAVFAAGVLSFADGESRWGGGATGTFSVGLYTQTWALCAFPIALGHAARWIGATPRNATLWRSHRPAAHLGLAIAWGTFVGMCHPFAFIALGVAFVAAFVGLLMLVGVDLILTRPVRPVVGELLRSIVLGLALVVAMMPIWLPLVIDYAGFGGFPRRVNDEIGPGFKVLWAWFKEGRILDWGINKKASIRVLTLLLPIVVVGSAPIVLLRERGLKLRWLWMPTIAYAVFLGLGPHLGKTNDDLLPMVRFLGMMQALAAMGIGAGAFAIGRFVWEWAKTNEVGFWIRTGIAAIGTALAVMLVQPQTVALQSKVLVLPDLAYRHEPELRAVIEKLRTLPPGRKQAVGGAVSSFWNLLPYVYARRETLLQMGGGGLQASPNYIFLLEVGDLAKAAWLFDAPFIVFEKAHEAEMPVGEDRFETALYQIRELPAEGMISPVQITGVLPDGRKAARDAAVKWLKSTEPYADHFLAYPGYGPAGDMPHATVSRAAEQASPGDEADLFAEVTVTAPTTFVARVSWHPRWHAYLDGREAPVRRVTTDFIAVDAPTGTKLIQFRFERPPWATAAWLAWPATAVLAWLAAAALGRGRQEVA